MTVKKVSIFYVQRIIRDARSTSGAQRALLNALGLRCNPEEGFKCWPSYAKLALDTQLDPATLKRAAKKLEDAGLIGRVVRRNRSNYFFIKFAVLVEQARVVKEAEDLANLAEAAALRLQAGADGFVPEDVASDESGVTNFTVSDDDYPEDDDLTAMMGGGR